MRPMKFGFGQAIVRKEDDALLRGAGRYVGDHVPEGTLHAVVLRSPHAHARIRITDTAAAKSIPGVRLVLTAADVAELGPLPCPIQLPRTKLVVPPYDILVRDTVRHVGDAVAFVVADTPEAAKDGAEAIAVEYEPLPHVVDSKSAVAPGAPQVWPTHKGNIAFEISMGDGKTTDAAFAEAAHVTELTLVNQRLATNYIDTRGAVAEYDPADDRVTLTCSSQGPHAIRDILCDAVLKMPREKMRVITPDVGGGFGTKLFPYREYALVVFAAKRLRRPVRWISDRSEHFLADAHGRDNLTTARLALDADGKFLALDVDTLADMGAYFSAYAPYIPVIGAAMLPGVYDIPACRLRVRGTFTHTVPVDAYRGAGRPEASYVIERLVDTAARELGLGPDELRRRNFIPPEAMPYRTQTGKNYDSGEFAGHLSRAQEMVDWSGFEPRWEAAKAAGKLRGIGVASYIEACGANGPETATLKLDKSGDVTVLIGSQATGQGHQTAYAQLVADHLDLPPERVRVIQGDTGLMATGAGTGGSSSISVGGAAVSGAARQLADNLKQLASDHLEASAGDLELADGFVRVAGTDRAVSIADLAAEHAGKPELDTADTYQPDDATFPNGTHAVEVEIDPDTGEVAIVNYAIVDDFGVTLNPLMLAGQVHGGAVQGIGQALMERVVYDTDSGQLISASLMDYALPRAADVPPFAFETRNIRCKTNRLGVKGAGEAGAIGSCPALMNAIVDALDRAYGIRHIDMPATPERLWQAIREGRRLHTL